MLLVRIGSILFGAFKHFWTYEDNGINFANFSCLIFWTQNVSIPQTCILLLSNLIYNSVSQFHFFHNRSSWQIFCSSERD